MAFLWRRKSLLTGLLPSCTNGQKLQDSFPFSLSFEFTSMFPPEKTPPLWGHTHIHTHTHILMHRYTHTYKYTHQCVYALCTRLFRRILGYYLYDTKMLPQDGNVPT